MRRRVLGSRLANDESPILRLVADRFDFFSIVLFCLVFIGCLFLLLLLFFHIQDPLNVYVQIFAPCKELRIPESWTFWLVECSVALCKTYRTLQENCRTLQLT